MPTARIFTPDGQVRELPLPEGMTPTPEEMAQILKDANIPTLHVTPEQPRTDAAASPGQASSAPSAPSAAPTVGSAAKTALSAIFQAVSDRTIGPAKDLVDPKVGMFGKAAALAQLAANTWAVSQPELYPVLAAGVGLQAATQAAGASPDAARAVGAVPEIGGTLVDLWRMAPRAKAAVRELIQSAPGAFRRIVTYGPKENIGQEVLEQTTQHFTKLNKALGAEFDVLEDGLRTATPVVDPKNPAFTDANAILNYADEAQAYLPGDAKAVIARIRAAVQPSPGAEPAPLYTNDLIKLRKILQNSIRPFRGLDPDAATAARKSAELHGIVTDVLKSAGGPDFQTSYEALAQRFVREYANPLKFIGTLTAPDVTPMQAFDFVYMTKDPHFLRTLWQTVGQDPAFTAKLRAGFAESMANVALDPNVETGTRTALQRLTDFSPLLTGSGMYSPREVAALRDIIASKQMPALVQTAQELLRSPQGKVITALLGANVAAQLATHPAATATVLLLGATKAGVGALRRASQLPGGTAAQQRLITITLRNGAQALRSYLDTTAPPPSEVRQSAAGGAFVQ